MPNVHQFGGNWTEEKLKRLEKYLSAYTTIFTKGKWAQKYQTHYVDAFAGTGERVTHNEASETLSLFDTEDTQTIEAYYRGSARIALEVEPSFDNFLFIERNPQHVVELQRLLTDFPSKAKSVEIREGDANEELKKWCSSMNWEANRAVVFLDPYGMSVTWSTVQAIANTNAIDLWILLPVGQAINRLLTRKGIPEGPWAAKLTSFFGTDVWKDEFYRPSRQPGLFDELDDEYEKIATFESISHFFYKRLDSVFERVADDSLILMNSKNNPLFVLFFAASNPNGASLAVKIAGDVMRK